jgi:hypothetical protein
MRRSWWQQWFEGRAAEESRGAHAIRRIIGTMDSYVTDRAS